MAKGPAVGISSHRHPKRQGLETAVGLDTAAVVDDDNRTLDMADRRRQPKPQVE
jgi:hypothetical protein